MKRLPRSLWLPILLLVAAIVAFAVVRWRGAREREQNRQQLLADVAAEVGKARPDGNELSQLRVRVQHQGDPATDRRLLLALVQIERARGHLHDAWERLKSVATAGDALTAEQHEGAVVLLGIHQHSGDRERAREAQSLAEAAFGSTHDPDDLLLAWTAAQRLANVVDRDRFAQELREQHAGSKEGRLVQTLVDIE